MIIRFFSALPSRGCFLFALSTYLYASAPVLADMHNDTVASIHRSADLNPFETRDQNPFNLIHGQPSPTSANLMQNGSSRWSSSLIITNTTNIEQVSNESIHMDFEAYRLNLGYLHGLSENWNLKLDIPIQHYTGGIFDSAIENWHDFFGLPNGQRPSVDNNLLNIRYTQGSQVAVDLSDNSTSLGDIQIAIARKLLDQKHSAVSIWAGIKLPTGDENTMSGSGATDFSAWLAMDHKPSQNWTLNLNAGTVIPGNDDFHGIPVSDYIIYGHVSAGWLVTQYINLKAQLQGHTSYYEDSELKILGDAYLLSLGGTITINQCQHLDIAISEDIKVSSSPDISLLINWRVYSSYC